MDYDVIVIGGGTAGLGAYRKAVSMGKKSLIVEEKDFVTTCANVGCMPSKLLIAAAEVCETIKKAQNFGIHVNSYEVNAHEVFQRVRSERDRFVGFVKRGAESLENKIYGRAKFIEQNAIEVNGKKITANSFVIATGSHPMIPQEFFEVKDLLLTNENVFELNEIPKKIAVFGAGVIGLELGFAFKELGADVSLFSPTEHLLKLHQGVNDYLVKHLKENFNVISHHQLKKVEFKDNQFFIYYNDEVLIVDKILMATGRRPNLEKLGLEVFGLHDTKHILSKYNHLTTQLGQFGLFLAGDVNSDLPLLHEAAIEGAISGENASTYPKVKEHVRKTPISIVFSHPQIMKVGKTNFNDYDVKGAVSFEDQGRSRVMLKNKGILELYFHPVSRLLVGAEMMGPSAEHIAHQLTWLIEKKTTVDELVNFPFYHPVVEEGLRTAVRDAYSQFEPIV
jgi:dihydrolipoamide dehydrogenase